jgi:hypothetical protein
VASFQRAENAVDEALPGDDGELEMSFDGTGNVVVAGFLPGSGDGEPEVGRTQSNRSRGSMKWVSFLGEAPRVDGEVDEQGSFDLVLSNSLKSVGLGSEGSRGREGGTAKALLFDSSFKKGTGGAQTKAQTNHHPGCCASLGKLWHKYARTHEKSLACFAVVLVACVLPFHVYITGAASLWEASRICDEKVDRVRNEDGWGDPGVVCSIALVCLYMSRFQQVHKSFTFFTSPSVPPDSPPSN